MKKVMLTEFFIKSILAEELFGKRITESLEDNEIVDVLYEEMMLEKLLYGEPVSVEELRKILRNKIVNFEFIKLNGEVRPARGTTMMKYIPPKDHPKGVRPSSDKVATFYDLDKDAWRSVSRRSKEIVLKKGKEKPVVTVRDKDKEQEQEFKQGKYYEYTTRKGEKTYVRILRQMDNGKYQVYSPVYRTTFAVPPKKLGKEVSENEFKKYHKKETSEKTQGISKRPAPEQEEKSETVIPREETKDEEEKEDEEE